MDLRVGVWRYDVCFCSICVCGQNRECFYVRGLDGTSFLIFAIVCDEI